MAAILNSTRDGLMLIGQKGELILVNPSAEKLVNYPLSEHLGESILRIAVDSLRQGGKASTMSKGIHHIIASLQREPDNLAGHSFQGDLAGSLRDIDATVLPLGHQSAKVVGRVAGI